MEAALWYLALGTAGFFLIAGWDLIRGNRSTVSLESGACPGREDWPRVSIIVAARNEEVELREALRSLLDQDYPSLEVIVVNDRSTDRTGEILAAFGSEHPGMKVLTVEQLPEGWLGKTHALYQGARAARGALLLFTDADVRMHPETVRRSVGHLLENRLDHLTLGPEILTSDAALEVAVGVFSVFFALFTRPWKARDPRSRASIGIGAFNLVRAEVYRAIGTHRVIAMRPDDDLKLGRLIKENGYRQEFLFGAGMIAVRWYPSVRGLVDGLMKNTFAVVEYRIAAVVAASLAQFLLYVWPFLALLLTSGGLWAVNLAIVLAIWGICWEGSRVTRVAPWFGLGVPWGVLLLIYIEWKAMFRTLLRGGIEWRGTHYPLKALKANRPPPP